MTVLEFIDKNFKNSVLNSTADNDKSFGLPFPYTVSTPGGVFDCMFYWDTLLSCRNKTLHHFR